VVPTKTPAERDTFLFNYLEPNKIKKEVETGSIIDKN